MNVLPRGIKINKNFSHNILYFNKFEKRNFQDQYSTDWPKFESFFFLEVHFKVSTAVSSNAAHLHVWAGQAEAPHKSRHTRVRRCGRASVLNEYLTVTSSTASGHQENTNYH